MNKVSFWVRIYGLPLKLQYKALAKKIGNNISTFEEMDMKECNRMGKIIWIRASLDLRKPLKRCSKLKF
jgi:hypothetical protein